MIKTIVVPVDFSDVANNALLFAAEISKRSAAQFTIMHALPDGDNEEDAKNHLKRMESQLQSSFGAALKFDSFLAHGDLIHALETLVGSQRPDLVVMGTKGASGLGRIFIGSNTVKVISNTNVPILVIPEVARFENFDKKGKNRVVLATDLEEVENDDALDVLKEIALLMIEPQLRVLNVRSKNTTLDFQKGMERAALVSRFSPEIETERVTVFSTSVMDGIDFYLNKNTDTGLIAMVSRDSGNLIQRHFTREMAAVTDFPLLILRDSKI